VIEIPPRFDPGKRKPKLVRRFLGALGPGVITGAADDDPAGIATYSIAGARFGTGLLWLAPLTWPLMVAVQTMCARVGIVTGGGLMDALRRKFPPPVLFLAAAALFGANTFNVGADLAGMADAAELLTGVNSRAWIVIFGLLIAWATIALRYATFTRILKWLVLVLFAYIVAAFSIGPDWGEVARATFLPSIPQEDGAWATIVAILGTTISPYLFFWQASEEVEEEKAKGRRVRFERVGATRSEILASDLDVGVGTFFCNLTFFFIILTTALTLHRHGITQPATSTEVASALRPIAGPFATLLYTAGIVGTGALAIPTLAGSAAYGLSELFGWKEGMDERLSGAPGFYGVFALSMGCAVAMDFAHFSVVRALYVSAIINGLLAPFLLVGILAVASDPRIMGRQPSSRLNVAMVLITTLLMLIAAAGMFIF
jgi:NRAMP (natural resistance-associated macrophage protein)-like metal ion transporter